MHDLVVTGDVEVPVEVLDEGAAERHVQHLGAAADRKCRQVALDGHAAQSDVALVANGVDARRLRIGDCAVVLRVDVAATGHHQAVDALDEGHRVELGVDRRQQDGHPARLAHSLDVRGVDGVMERLGVALGDEDLVGRDADERTHQISSK